MSISPRAMTARLGLIPLLIAAAPAETPYHWQNVTVGAGGFAPNIVFSTARRGLAYLRTDMGGAYRWDDAAGRWVAMTDGLAEGSYQGVESIAPDPVDPEVVYMAAGMGRRSPAAILRSADQGRHWAIHPVGFAMGGNEDGRGLGERLAIDPNHPSTLFFGSRHDGLQSSDDSGATWHKVASFPLPGLGQPAPGWRAPTHAGIAWVEVDPDSGRPGTRSRTLFAGSADPGPRHIFRSDDGGTSWEAVPGGPRPDLLPTKAALDGQGRLFVAFDDGIGPNGITRGAVWRLDTHGGGWTDVTPDKRPDAPAGGYMGLALDRLHPGTVAVTTVDRWHPVDTLWRSTDGGAHWQDLGPRSVRDVSATPFLVLDGKTANMGHWMAGLAIDPFDGDHIAYTTGATLYATRQGSGTGQMTWTPWVSGIEQTAIIALSSPTAGAPLVSGFGDIGGFVHDALDRSPPHLHTHPYLTNTNNLDFAGLAPAVMVRSGNQHGSPPWAVTLARSTDGGHSWEPMVAEVPGLPREDRDGKAAITVSADGHVFALATPHPLRSTDDGRHWEMTRGLPPATRAVADKVDPLRFYAVDFGKGRVLASNDGGASFTLAGGRGLPADLSRGQPRNSETPYPLIAEPGRAGSLWLKLDGAIWHSADGGNNWVRAPGPILADLLALGARAPGSSAPTLFATGLLGTVHGVFRSIDGGVSWTRINNDEQQWGLRFRVIEGDPKRFGRVYLGTDGRGILYGDPAF